MPRARGMHGERLDAAIGRVESVVVRVLRAIAGRVARLVGDSPSAASLSDDDLQVIRRDWGEAVTVDIVPAISDVFIESAGVLAKEFADAGRPVEVLSLEAPSAADFLAAATNRLVGVADTLWEVARRELADGVRAGEGIEELAARLQEAGGFGEARARTIARTEVVAAANAASLAQALRLGDAAMRKQWLATMDAGGVTCDERTRAAHCAAHEQVQPLGEPFEVGGTWLMYPGQPIGPADAVINCRCTPGYLFGDESVEEPLTAAAPDEFHLPGKHDQDEHGKYRGGIPDSIGGRSSGGSRDRGNPPRRDGTSVGETVRKYGPKSLTLAAHDDGQLSLTDNDGNQVRLTPADVNELRTRALYSYDMDVGDEFAVTHTDDRDGAPYTTLRMLIRKTAAVPEGDLEEGEESYLRDTLSVHLAPNDDPDFDELRAATPVEMTARELADLAQAFTDLETAGRVDTGHGQVDMFTDGRSWVLRPVDGPELRLNRRGFRTLDRALDAVVEEFDDEEGTRSDGPLGEDGTAERTVDTNVGQVTVSLDGGLGVGDLTIRVPDHDVEIVVGPAQQTAFLRQLGSLSEVLTASARRMRSTMQTDVPLEVVTAAAEVHTGAMVALRPSAEDAERLAVEGGELADQLHATLTYLGDAADIPAEVQQTLISRLRALVEDAIRADYDLPMRVEGFSVDLFNPPGVVHEDGKDRDTCIVLGLSGGDLDVVHRLVAETVVEVFGEAGLTLPEQHTPWRPHTTLIYTDDVDMVPKLVDRAGPVTFDAIRVAFGGENTDIPLRPLSAEVAEEPHAELAAALADEQPAGLGNEVGPPEGWDEYFADRLAEFVQTDAKLRQYWLYGPGAARIRWGTKGDFTRCVRQLRKYVRDPEGLCAEYHHERLGIWPGEKKNNASLANQGTESETCPPGQHRMPDGECMPDADMAAVEGVTEEQPTTALGAEPGEHFHTWVMEGVSTGLRQFAPDAITWRDPPFAYHWQWKSSAHNGLPETVQTGLVTRVVRDGNVVHFFGKLDLKSPEGLDYARRVAEGWARWSSVGVDESVKNANIDVEYVLTDGEPSLDEEPEVDLMTFRDYRVAEVTGVSVPALADALVEPTQELIDTLTAMGVIEPGQVDDAPPAVEEAEEDEVADFSAVRSPNTQTTDGPQVADVHAQSPTVIVASGHTITIPNIPPAEWFQEPSDVTAEGALTITDEGRVYGYLAPAGVAHRSFRNRRVEVPMGNVDYSRWMGGEAIVAGGGRVVAGPITFECGHCDPAGPRDSGKRMEHYDNTCSVAAKAAIGENAHGVWIAGALEPGVTGEQVSRMLACRLSGDWAPHPEKAGMREFVAALLVPVPGFAMGRRAASTVRVQEGALVAAAVPVRFADDMEEPMEMEQAAFAEGDTVRVVDDGVVGEVVAVHTGPAFAVRAVEGEPPRWHVAEELEPADVEPVVEEPVEVEELVASAEPDLRPVLDFMARKLGRDPVSRMETLRARVHHTN